MSLLTKFKNFFQSTPAIASPVAAAVAPVTYRNYGATVAFVNQSTVVTDAEIKSLVAALQVQVDRDFAPFWKISANLRAIPTGTQPPTGAWVIYIMDTSDQAGALGYHDVTSDGTPLGRVFAKDDMKYGLSWTVTASHELLELLCDPWISNTVFVQDTNTTGTLYALEVCDAPEDDSFGYFINGIKVSDFVYPSWFESYRAPHSTQFDHHGVITAPFQLLKGGYIGYFPVNPNTRGWQQKLAEGTPGARAVRKGQYSRTMRRGIKPAA